MMSRLTFDVRVPEPARRHGIAALLLILAALVTAAQVPQSPRELFERARMLEESNGSPTEAISLYRQVAAQAGDRRLAATAQFRLGLLQERLGQREDAQRAFRAVVERFTDVPEIARQAQARLAPPPQRPSAPSARRLWAGAEVDLSGSVSPDGRFLSYVDWETGDLAVRELASGTSRRLTGNPRFMQAAGFAQESSFSPDGRQIAYAWFHDNGMDLRVIGADGGAPRVLLDGADHPVLRVSWGPSGIAVVVLRPDRTHQLAMVDPSTGRLHALKTFDWREPARIAASPDGRYVAYDFPAREDSPNRDIHVLAADGSREAVVGGHAANDLFAVWTPDARHLVFVSDRTGAPGLWTVPMADGKPDGAPRLIQPLGTARPLGISRGGAFYYGLGTGTIDVYTAALDVGTGGVPDRPRVAARQITGVNSRPRWSPDGRSFVYQSDRVPGGGLGARRLILQDVATGRERDLDVRLPYFQRAEWFPDGRSLLVQGRSSRGARGFFKVNLDSRETTLLIPRHDRGGYAPVWTAGGASVIFSTSTQGTETRVLLEHNPTTRDERIVYSVPDGRSAGDSSLSRDGKWLAFREGNAPTTINVMPVAGGERRELVRIEEPDSIPGWGGINWTPDGRHLLFVISSGPLNQQRTVWKVPVSGGPPTKTALGATGLRDLHLHPDGRRVLFTAGEGSDEVWVLDRLLPPHGARTSPPQRGAGR